MNRTQVKMRTGRLQKKCLKMPEGMIEMIDDFREQLWTERSIELSFAAAVRHLISSSPAWSDVSFLSDGGSVL